MSALGDICMLSSLCQSDTHTYILSTQDYYTLSFPVAFGETETRLSK